MRHYHVMLQRPGREFISKIKLSPCKQDAPGEHGNRTLGGQLRLARGDAAQVESPRSTLRSLSDRSLNAPVTQRERQPGAKHNSPRGWEVGRSTGKLEPLRFGPLHYTGAMSNEQTSEHRRLTNQTQPALEAAQAEASLGDLPTRPVTILFRLFPEHQQP